MRLRLIWFHSRCGVGKGDYSRKSCVRAFLEKKMKTAGMCLLPYQKLAFDVADVPLCENETAFRGKQAEE